MVLLPVSAIPETTFAEPMPGKQCCNATAFRTLHAGQPSELAVVLFDHAQRRAVVLGHHLRLHAGQQRLDMW